MGKLLSKIRSHFVEFILWNYRKFYIPLKARNIRRKPVIKVAFIIHSLGAWKSESLYKKMLEHPRFDPRLMILRVDEEDDRDNIKEYLKEKNYNYVDITEAKSIRSVFNPDIIFYQKPYSTSVPFKFGFKKNLRSLFCYVNYGFHGVDEKWSRDTDLLNNCWQIYYENELARNGSKSVMRNKCKNGIISGLPIMDELSVPKESILDPWQKQQYNKKRIIWAPHHSVCANDWLSYSNFFKYADTMLSLAKKYSSSVQWAFKPHPLLRKKVESIWGIEKTRSYWEQWNDRINTQLEPGKYLGLFKYSDAMIHDCGSFTIEYLYSGNPVMYLIRDEAVSNGFNGFQQKAFDLHQKGYSEDDIENFIKSIIAGDHFNEIERKNFFRKYLLVPDGTSTVDNIISSIIY